MRIGEVFPLRIQVNDTPVIDLRDAELFFVVANNGKVKFTFKLGGTDGEVAVEQDENSNYTIATAEGITREQSIQLVKGKIVIELLIKTPDTNFPTGFFTIGRFEEFVEDSYTTDL